MVLTDAGPSWDRRLADPERHPGQHHQEGGGNVGLQDEEQHIPTQGKVQHQLGVFSYNETHKEK